MVAFIPSPSGQSPEDLQATPDVLPERGHSSSRLTSLPGITDSPSLSTPHPADLDLAHSGLQRPSWLSKQTKKHTDKYVPESQREILRRGC